MSSLLRSCSLLMLAGLNATALAQPLPCVTTELAGGGQDVSCALPAAAAAQRYRFRAEFSGGHDDTMASMRATLDGAALPCDDGSKTELMGEFGDVGLECRFLAPPQADAQGRFKVALRWSHADFMRTELMPD